MLFSQFNLSIHENNKNLCSQLYTSDERIYLQRMVRLTMLPYRVYSISEIATHCRLLRGLFRYFWYDCYMTYLSAEGRYNFNFQVNMQLHCILIWIKCVLTTSIAFDLSFITFTTWYDDQSWVKTIFKLALVEYIVICYRTSGEFFPI